MHGSKFIDVDENHYAHRRRENIELQSGLRGRSRAIGLECEVPLRTPATLPRLCPLKRGLEPRTPLPPKS